MTLWQAYLLEINAVAFILCAIDKHRGTKGKWRIPEATLLLSAVLGGSAGLLLGMLLLWHKVQRKKFILGVPCILLLQLTAVYFLVH